MVKKIDISDYEALLEKFQKIREKRIRAEEREASAMEKLKSLCGSDTLEEGEKVVEEKLTALGNKKKVIDKQTEEFEDKFSYLYE